MLTFRSELECIPVNDPLVGIMQQRLKCVDKTLPTSLVNYYNCSFAGFQFEEIMLSSDGFRCPQEKNVYNVMDICVECFVSLNRRSIDNLPPPLAIANHFWIGALPKDLQEATYIEKLMTALVSVVAQTRIMHGGKHRSIQSHAILFDTYDNKPPACALPRMPNQDSLYRIILAGELTSEQTNRVRKQHECRHEIVQKVVQFYKTNNILYENIDIDTGLLQELKANKDNDTFVPEGIFTTAQVPTIDPLTGQQAMNCEQQRIGVMSTDAHRSNIQDEQVIIERTSIYAMDAPTETSTVAQNILNNVCSKKNTNQDLFKLYHSSNFSQDNLGIQEAKSHPHLFPYGRGHYGENRRVKVGARACVNRRLHLSDRVAALDNTYDLTMFDRIGLNMAWTKSNVFLKNNPAMLNNMVKVEKKHVAIALERRHHKLRGVNLQNNSFSPTTDEQKYAERFLRNVDISSSFIWGSNGERTRSQQEVFATADMHGPAQVFATIAIRTDNTITMAYIAGKIPVQTLLDSEMRHLPTTAEMHSISMADNVSAARLYNIIIEIFLKIAIGIDPKTKRGFKNGGLFGVARGYYGLTETQTSGALHCHILIWLVGFPKTIKQTTDMLNDPAVAQEFKRRLSEYADSIATTTLPIPVKNQSCSTCGNESPAFDHMPIPVSAQKSPFRKNHIPTEPALHRCKACKTDASSQHLIRQALTATRPIIWPPALSELNPIEFAHQIALEKRARPGYYNVQELLEYRENINQQYKIFLDDTNRLTEKDDAWLVSLIASQHMHEHDAPIRKYVKNEDDTFFTLDRIVQELQNGPVGPDFNRYPQSVRDFALAVLVVLNNQHWWSHCRTCFKTSRRTTAANLCRYAFPKDRVDSTSFIDSAVMITRLAAHEYINAYNPVIMSTFRCNHDIQLLVGGPEMSEIVYYVTKYATKNQHDIEAKTAYALAAMDRRRERERAELEKDH